MFSFDTKKRIQGYAAGLDRDLSEINWSKHEMVLMCDQNSKNLARTPSVLKIIKTYQTA